MNRWTIFECLALFIFSGCAAPKEPAYFESTPTRANVYIAPDAPAVKKVAVMPFKAPTALIGESVADLWVTEVLRSQRYEVVERSRLAQVLSETELAMAGLSAAKAAAAGAMAGADAVIIGTVDEYAAVAQRLRTVPVVGISARMVDCETGKIIWSVDHSKKGDADATLPQLARTVVHEMMSAVYKARR